MARRVLATTTACLLVAGAGFAGITATPGIAAAAATSPVVLSTGPSGQANNMMLVAASAAGIVYNVLDVNEGLDTNYLRSADGTVTALTAPFTSDLSLVGDLLSTFDWGTQTFSYRTVDGTTSGSANVPNTEYLAASADGYFSMSKPDGVTLHLYDTDVTSDVKTDFGAIPDNPARVTVRPGPQGFLLATAQQGGFTPQSVYYRRYSPDGSFTLLGSNLPVFGGPTLDSTSAAWLENPAVFTGDDESIDGSATTLVRMNLDGSDSSTVRAPWATWMAMVSGVVGWTTMPPIGEAASFSTVSADGTTATATVPLTMPAWLASTGTEFVLDQTGTPTTAGIYERSSAADTGTQIVPAGASAFRGFNVASGPGRVAWSDNGVGGNLWDRDLAITDSPSATITPGAPTAIAPAVGPQTISVSGSRTAYFDRDFPWGFTLKVHDAADGTTQQLGKTNDGYGSVTISGTRVLQSNSDGSAVLYDLVRHTSTALPSPTSRHPFIDAVDAHALSGDDLASIAPDGSVWVENLVTGAVVEVSGPVSSAGQSVYGNVAIAGDNVAWLVWVCTSQGGGVTSCVEASAVQYRNFRTMGNAYTLANEYPGGFALSSGYLAFREYTGDGWAIQVNPLYTQTVNTIAPTISDTFYRNYSISGATLSWIGSDNLPYVEALGTTPDVPRYLGNGIAPSSFITSPNAEWDGDFVASAPLTTCSVTISDKTGPVRTLDCDASQMPYGDARVRWDGNDAAGQPVSPGTYSWVLNASNASGALLDADGGQTPVSGAISVSPPPTGGGGGGAGGGGTASGTVPAGGSLWSSGGDPDSTDPVVVGITTPTAGDVTITTASDSTPHSGDRGIESAVITAPAATAAEPLQLTFKVLLGDFPADAYPSDVQIFRDGTAIAPCTGGAAATTATPDPCVKQSSVSGDIATFVVLSSHASTWQLESTNVGRLAGPDRLATAVAISQAGFPAGGADAVVLASANAYPDSMVGGPLAARRNAPLLLTSGDSLPSATKAELLRVLPAHRTVYLLGGTAAIPASVETQLGSLGYQTTRLAGSDRFGTAVAVADALGDPSTVFLASGLNYPDALAAGPAAARVSGVILLTDGTSLPAMTTSYLAAHGKTVYAVGGPAAASDPAASAIVGADRYSTAAAIATRFFASPAAVGVASGENYPDALAAGPLLAREGAPLLLTGSTAFPDVTAAYIRGCPLVGQAHIFGGSTAVSDTVKQAVGSLLPE